MPPKRAVGVYPRGIRVNRMWGTKMRNDSRTNRVWQTSIGKTEEPCIRDELRLTCSST